LATTKAIAFSISFREEDFQELKKKREKEKTDVAHEKRIVSLIEFCAVLHYFSNI